MNGIHSIGVLLAGGILAATSTMLPRIGWGAELSPLPPPKPQKAQQVELGRYLFFDPRLSGDGGISCATCHQPEKGWGDGLPLSKGYPGSAYFRNAQTLLNAVYQKRLYWEGRMSGADLPTLVRDHLTEAHFMQVDGRLFPERLKQIPQYVEGFRKAFGGEPTFGRTLKALASFLQTLVSRNVPFDRYLKGETAALSPLAKKGLALFQGKGGCIQCHSGPLLSDGRFHALGVPENPRIFQEPLRHITFRRFYKVIGVENYIRLREDVGLYAVTKAPGDRGKFRTPTLREVARTAPYMHNGVYATLAEVVAFYDGGGGKHPNKSPLLKPLGLSEDERRALMEFLRSLSGDPVRVQEPELPEYEVRELGQN
ncbi:MAG: cytochrome-c peroxidase [Nitrospinota bacterium]